MKYFTKTHEWVEKVGDVYRVGISDHAQAEMNDVVFVEPIEPGSEIKKGERLGSIESVKAAEDILAPVDLKVVKFNEALNDEPDLLNRAAETDGWIVEVEVLDENQINELMNEEEYKNFIS